MNKLFTFPNFHYDPIKLGEKVKYLQNKYKEKGQVSEKVVMKRLPDLLAHIRSLKNERNEIIKFANTLKNIDIKVLASEYPYENEEEITADKIITILKEKYMTMVGRRFWSHYQHFPLDANVVKMLSYVFQKEDSNFLSLESTFKKEYEKIFDGSNAQKTLHQLSYEIGSLKKTINKSFKERKIQKDSKLSHYIWQRVLNIYLKEQWFIDVQGVDIIIEKLKNIKLKKYKKVISNYLSDIEYNQYNEKIMMQVIERLLDPRESVQRWSGISEPNINKVKSYLMEKELSKFFRDDSDSKRFQYWRRYVQYMEDADFVKEPSIVVMYFPKFTVVEFALVGNAVYFYEREGFSKYLSHKIKRYVKVEDLKNTDASYFIYKLNHSGHWQSRYDQYMMNFLRSDFSYRH